MAEKLAARIDVDAYGDAFLVLTARDRTIIGKAATVTIEAHGDVTRGGGIDVTRPLATIPVRLEHESRVALPAGARECYRYAGRHLNLGLRASVKIDDGVVFDTTETFDLDCPWYDRPCDAREVGAEVDPKDTFDFMKNLRAIPHAARMKVIAMSVVGAIVIGINSLVGVHDQFVPESRTWFYDHSDSKGKGESPFAKALAGSGAVGLALWAAIRQQLRRYIKLELKQPNTALLDTRVPARDLIAGVPHVAIDFCTVRVVAYNRERGRYKVKRKKETKTESFSHPVRSVLLYQQDVQHLPAAAPLADRLDGEIDFGRAYAELLPPLQIDAHTGIDVQWELQLIHRDYVDHEITGHSAAFDPALFHPKR